MDFEFNTPEELNERAKELLKEEKQKELSDLAKDNGIDAYLLEAFSNGEIPFLVPDAFTMAAGKLDVEVSKLSSDKEMGQIIADHLKSKAMEDEKLALAICQKNKLLKDVCKKAWDEAEKKEKSEYSMFAGNGSNYDGKSILLGLGGCYEKETNRADESSAYYKRYGRGCGYCTNTG